jgi:hypothetical protein
MALHCTFTMDKDNGRWRLKIGRWLRLCDDVDRLHVKIDNLNNPLVRFCFIRNIDKNANSLAGSLVEKMAFIHPFSPQTIQSATNVSISPGLNENVGQEALVYPLVPVGG